MKTRSFLRAGRGSGTGRAAPLAASIALALSAPVAADETYRDLVRQQYRHQSYTLIETPGRAPRLLLLTTDTDAVSPKAQSAEANDPIGRALLELGDADPAVREEAILSLAELGADPAIFAAALNDPSTDVRDTAEAVLEDLAGSEE